MREAAAKNDRSSLFGHLLGSSKALLSLAVVASIGHGACSVLVLSQIARAISTPGQSPWTFALAALGMLICHATAAAAFVGLSQRIHAEIRSFLFEGTMAAPLRSLESVGPSRVQAALAEHGSRVGDLFLSLPLIIANTVVVVGCLTFMAVLSPKAFAAALTFLLLGSASYYAAVVRSLRHLDHAAKEQDRLFGKFSSMTAGAKELRLNASRSKRFRQLTLDAIESVRSSKVRGLSVFAIAGSWGNFLIFCFVSVVLFAPPFRDGGAQVMVGFSLVLIYMIHPLQALLTNIPSIGLAKSAAGSIDRLLHDLEVEPASEPASLHAHHPPAQSVELKQVTFRYSSDATSIALLGPLNLKVESGEILFIVGGNGSGKTTMAKVLAGLYVPDSGEVWADGVKIQPSSLIGYRQRFSAVFADYHLFDNLLESTDDVNGKANALLDRLQLTHKVKVANGAFTTTNLSQGQRKRLALVSALLEDRPYLIFDEWAADQDPIFKDFFYREVLPELKAKGKGVVVISHDDRYFDCGDRVLFMEEGLFVTPRPPVGPRWSEAVPVNQAVRSNQQDQGEISCTRRIA